MKLHDLAPDPDELAVLEADPGLGHLQHCRVLEECLAGDEGVIAARSWSTVIMMMEKLPLVWKTTLILACWSFLVNMSATLKLLTTIPTWAMGRSRRNRMESTSPTKRALKPLSPAGRES